jgi:L-lactate dehydrogenase complex protein LldG
VTTKEVFLRRLRTAAGPGAPPPHRPLVLVDRPPEVRPVWPDATSSVTDRWVRSFEGLGGHVHRSTAERAVATIAEVVAGRGPVLVDERVRHRLGPDDAANDRGDLLVWPGCGLAAAATAVSGVVDATAAIACTGSVVVDSDRNGRLVSLLPRVAVFVLSAGDIVPVTGDLLRHHGERWPDGPPTNVVLVTGPSRSGDIEMRLVVGVHGPGEVHAILIDG